MWTRRELLALLAVASLITTGGAAVLLSGSGPIRGLLPFQSYAELSSYLSAPRSSPAYFGGTRNVALAPSPVAGPATGAPSAGTAPAYSGTNVQVAGVDELDPVKTDGTYLYVASGDSVAILLAYPASDMHIVSVISAANLSAQLPGYPLSTSVTGLFLDGSRLAVVGDAYGCGNDGNCTLTPGTTEGGALPTVYEAQQRAFVVLFDVSDPASPRPLHTVTVSGYTSTGRMVDGVVYLVATQWISLYDGTYILPRTCADGICQQLAIDRIYHDPQSEDPSDYTNLLAVDAASGASKVVSVVTGGYSILYMSPTAMYLAFYKWTPMPVSMPLRMVGGNQIASLGQGAWTTIYKLHADGLDIEAVASADVPGSLFSQYAMDEWQGYLRVATTVRTFTETATTTTTTVTNGVYVFDGAMRLVGSVEGLAPGESIFAVRFVGDRAYIVTFRKIDPLFVIDLSDPARPAVSGFLEMPGFSDYLYPLDAGHLIGVGKDAVPAVDGNWSWYQGLKLALYDVTNPMAPSETSNVTVGDRGTDSEALYDPHAFLYVPDRNYVVLPVDLAVINASEYPGGVPDWAWGTIVWQGAIVYQVNETTGIREVGRVAHGDGAVNATCGWYGGPNSIQRSLYIGDVLYTISPTQVQANSLTDLSEIASVTYAGTSVSPYGCPVVIPGTPL